jgi:Skp family chaperone for outer membrane proteins
MDNQTLLLLLVAILGIIAVSFAVQAIGIILMMRSVKEIKGRLDDLTPKVEGALSSANETLATSRKQLDEINNKATAILDSAKEQLTTTNNFLTETTERASKQLDRIELVVDDTVSRVHKTVMVINDGVLAPTRQATAVIAGIRSAVDFLVRGGRPNVSQATTDEEMFI